MPLFEGEPLPAGGTYPPSFRAGMIRIDVSGYQRDLARIGDAAGVTHLFDPAVLSGGIVPDRAALGVSWSLAGAATAAPSPASINGRPALRFDHNATRWFRSSSLRPAGSFSVIMAWEVSDADAAVLPSVLWGIGPANPPVGHVRYQDGQLRYLSTNVDADGVIQSGIAPGQRIAIFSYDADTATGAVMRRDGSIVSTPFAAPPSDTAWNIGGWQDGYSASAKIGLTAISTRPLASAAWRALGKELIDCIAAEYGI
ncbi:hypothetical protein [uncultured Sphingomonas sp.]|uniref:hypothetical protein n=1 Tax=uncultured Sphingomonas sp. TaxID=158754 RepID=UPI0026331F51|nr:hypothetical protein [uncultured Sphingomonas sp.]